MEKRIPVKVSIHPSEYAGRSIRLGDPQSDIRDKMQQRMREFEDESRKWREQFLSNSGLGGGVGTSIVDHRPKMMVTFPEFPELSTNWLGRSGSGFFPPAIPSSQTAIASSTSSSSHKSFIEEDNDGSKKYKLQVEVGDFRPNELQVKTEGRLLVIKGDHELVSGSATESKQFNREITLPDFIEPTTVVSYLTDGMLTIEAPVIMERFGITNANNQAAAASSSINTSSSVNSIGFGNNFPTISRSPFREASPQRTVVATTNVKNNVSNCSREEFQNAERDLQNKFSNQQLFTDGLASVGTMSTPVGTIANSAASYKFNMSEFKPEDISITVTDTTLKVHAIREETDAKGVGKTYREFKREIGLPQGCDVKRLKNSLNPDGFLFIEIPVNDNSTLQPPQSPTIHKQFNNLSLAADNSAGGLVNRKSEISTFSSADSNLINERVNVGDKELKITFDLNGYKPEDVNIKVTDNTLKVHAVHIDNSKGNQIHREYSRSYILPEWVNPELLRARMSDNGTLTVEVPLPQVQPSKLERLIKIQKL